MPEHLIPAATDEDGEQLPDEFHSSYPFGNPYAQAQRTAPYASEFKLSPRLHLNLALANNPHLARPSGASKNAAKAPVNPELLHGASETLPSHLVLRAKTQHVPRTPDWPFVKFGPGGGGHTTLIRSELSHPQPAYRDVWADLALDRLQPKERDGIVDADPLDTIQGEGAALPPIGEGIGSGAPQPGIPPKPTSVVELAGQLGAAGVEQFPTRFSGVYKHMLSQAENAAMGAFANESLEGAGFSADELAERRREAEAHLHELRHWYAQVREGRPAQRLGSTSRNRGLRFEWGRGWVSGSAESVS